MTSIGETLRQERLRRGLELDQISHDLKISSRFLDAIENERFEKLPGGVFAKSFVRQYARHLGLDEEEFAAAAQTAIEPQPPVLQPTEHPKTPPVEISVPRMEVWESVGDRRFGWSSSLPALAMVVAVMLVCSGVYSWWQHNRRLAAARDQAPAPAAQVAQAPPQTAEPPVPAPQPEAQGQAASANPDLAAQPQASPPGSAEQPANAPPQNQAVPQAQTQPAATPSAPVTAAAAPPNTAPPAARGPVRVELTADEPVWVLARADGKYLFSGTLDANQTRSIDASGEVLLRLGNAGGVRITVNGKSLGAVGPKGQVRTVQLTSGGLQIVAAPKASPPPFDPL